MRRTTWRRWVAALAGTVLPAVSCVVAEGRKVDFSRDVLPILSDACFQCHGPDAKGGRKGDLRLDDEADAKRERGGYHVVKPGDVGASELIRRILETDPDEVMPPPELGRALNAEQKEVLRRWVAEGAEWGKHWAFERVERPEMREGEAGHAVDVLVGRVLKEKGMVANGRAGKEVEIRRLSLDLTGLPPALEEVEAYVADGEPGAWERLVERTLAKPAYGERMAWDWLEAARYADTNGYQGDGERTMWPWRDWVVKAFNENLPYDQFTVWQLAGDLLPEATDEQRLATAFNRNHMINGEGGRIAEENRVDYVFDMTETMGTVWLGLTLNCCRCHDHKFDPLTQREYYQLTAFFNQTPVDGGGGNPKTPPVMRAGTGKQKEEMEAARGVVKLAGEAVAERERALDAGQGAWEAKVLAEKAGKGGGWEVLEVASAKAEGQTLELPGGGLVYATGENPANDVYRVRYKLGPGEVSGFRLDAVRHPKMTGGGLARSDSGNFVLTDIAFELVGGGEKGRALEIGGAVATYEQQGHGIAASFDGDAKSGWAVWEGKVIGRDHAGVYRLKERLVVGEGGGEMEVTLRFGSPHASHNLGQFRISRTGAGVPELGEAGDGLVAALRVAAEKRSEEERKRVREAYHGEDGELAKLRKERSDAEGKLKALEGAVAEVMVMGDMEKPRATYVLERGLYTKRGGEVGAGVPGALPGMMVGEGGKADRLALARWLVSREHPLTARVTVNRVWQMLFGIGLVKTAEDFGVQAEYPVQRELLDWLAAEFMESGWDLKGLLRTVVTSETYRRSAVIGTTEAYERDPQNRYFARGPRFRMPSWMIRDQALAVSGLLVRAEGGEPVNSYQPDGVWEETSFGNKKYQRDSGEKLYRRSLYTYWRRISGPTVFFDTAKRQVCEVKPLRTNTPMHALTTLNDVTYVEAARKLAEAVMKELPGGDEGVRVRLAVRKVLGREATEEEEKVLLRSLGRAKEAFGADPGAAEKFLGHGESARDGGLAAGDLASWAALCLNLLNLDEALNKG